MNKGLFPNLRPFFSLARDAFAPVLLLYLGLFLLENLLPGFVSNNFSLNWLLGVVIAVGFLAACAPQAPPQELEKPTASNDYLLVVILGVIGGAVIFVKSDMSAVLRWATALVSAALIMLVGFVALSGEEAEVPQELGQENLPVARPSLRQLFELQFALVLLFVVCSVFLVSKNITILSHALYPSLSVAATPVPSPVPQPVFWDDVHQFEYVRPSGDIQISVLNGGADRAAAASFSAMLRGAGFAHVTVGNADRFDYPGALVFFHPEDKAQATVVKRFLGEMYPVVLEAPAPSSASGISVILGAVVAPTTILGGGGQ